MSHALSQRAAIEPPRSGSALKYIVLGTVVLNGLGFAVYKKLQLRLEAAPVERSEPQARTASPALEETKAPAPAEEDGKRDLARAHRASGLAALESGDYALAVRSFTSALKLSNRDTDSAELLKIAKELQDRAKDAQRRTMAPTEAAAAEPASAAMEAVRKAELSRNAAKAAPTKPASRSTTRRVAAVTREEPEEAAFGTLLVTSNPSGLLVEVDGRSLDLTPAKVRLDPGGHTVALLRGSTRLHERRIDISADNVLSVDVDVTPALRAERAARDAVPVDEDLAALSDPAEPSRPAPGPVAATSAARLSPAPPARQATTAQQPVPAPARPGSVGDVHVASSGVYGDVWINGIAFGPPPVLAKNVAAGRATVEIRVGGNTRRSKTVDVTPGQRTTLRLR